MKLTKAIREKMLDQALQNCIEAKLKKVKDRLSEIAQDVAINQYSSKVRKWMDEGPSEAFHTVSWVRIRIVGEKRENGTATARDFGHPLLGSPGYSRTNLDLKTPVKVFPNQQYNSTVECPKKYLKELNKIMSTLGALEAKKKAAKEVLQGALWSVNTEKQLRERYPDLVKFLPRPEVGGKAVTITNDNVKAALVEA